MNAPVVNSFQSIAVGAALLVGAWVVWKVVKSLSDATGAAGEAVGYLFGTSSDASLGSSIYDILHKTPAPLTGDALSLEVRACQFALDKYGKVTTDVCKAHLAAGHIGPKRYAGGSATFDETSSLLFNASNSLGGDLLW